MTDNAEQPIRVIIIGTGRMINLLVDILSAYGIDFIVLRDASQPLGFVKHDRGAVVYPTENINSPFVVDAIIEYAPDWILSANNFQKIGERWIKAFPGRILNFHNAPLPKYRGLNACTWAIWNGEKTHGVTWHMVSSGIDTGSVVSQRIFPISHNATALSLIGECIDRGVDLFEQEVLPQMISGKLTTKAQSGDCSFYRKADFPNGGRIDPSWTGKDVARLCRALDVGPYKLSQFFTIDREDKP